MPRPRSDGPKRVPKTLKDGTRWVYLYDRRTGQNIGKEPADKAEPVNVSTMAGLIAAYRASSRFRNLRPGTRDTYGYTLDYLLAKAGHLHVRSFTIGTVQAIKESLSDTPSKANQVLALLSILFKGARKQGLISANPAEDPGKFAIPPRIQIWSREEEARFAAVFRPNLRLMFLLMLYTLQRMSDVLDMTITQVTERDGRLFIVLRQAKTDELVGIPVHGLLDPLLRERLANPTGLLLVPSPRGFRWTRRNASRAWDADVKRGDAVLAAELKTSGWGSDRIAAELAQRHRQRRDLRRTGVVRMAEGGATTPQIAAVSGHSIDYCQRIIDTYLPRRTEVALGGIERWEAAEVSGSRVIRLSDVVAMEARARAKKERG